MPPSDTTAQPTASTPSTHKGTVPSWLHTNRVFLVPALLLLSALIALLVDCRLSEWFIEVCPSEIKRILHFCELFGHGFGVVEIAVLLHQLDPARRWAIPRVVCTSLAAGLVADVAKLLVERTRPYAFNLDNSILESFGGWLPLITEAKYQSFPSAHTATAVGMAMVLTWLYPQGRKLFPVLAVLVGVQRLSCGAHYLSDVLAGAALGIIIGTFFLRPSPISRQFDHWETPA
jgi:membrane-associated phospholipid phosphatase